MQGIRLQDTIHDSMPDGIVAGAYWREIDEFGAPCQTPEPGNLTHEIWWVAAPAPSDKYSGSYMLGRLTKHTVRLEDDGTISVRPNDGSSNSILIQRPRPHGQPTVSWHGYIEHGVWREC